MKKYPVVTLCGSTKFKEEFIRIQKQLTLDGYIVISVGLFGHSGDDEVWEGMAEDILTETKFMLDDMHKSKIDMAERIYVINPNGYIGESTWSEICYARMTGKDIDSLEPIDKNTIDDMLNSHIDRAEMLAARQYDILTHTRANYPSDDYLLSQMTKIKKGKYTTIDPWVPDDKSVPTCYEPYLNNADKKSTYNPFDIYGKQKMARFIEEIIIRYRDEDYTNNFIERKKELISKIEWYCRELEIEAPEGYPNDMSIDEMEKFVQTWDEFDPVSELN